MQILAGSAFQPDTASDWWNFAINALISVLTLAALVVAVRQAKHASDASGLAQSESARVLKREAQRERQLRIDDLRQRAARQALSVSIATQWYESLDGWDFGPRLLNDSENVLRDVVITFDNPEPNSPRWLVEIVRPGGGYSAPGIDAADFDFEPHADASFVVDFTDTFSDRWQLRADGSLKLVGERRFADIED